MNNRTQRTAILFPRIASRDGPAKTLFKEDFIDGSNEPDNPLFNPLRYGFSDETTLKVADKRTLITLNPPIPSTQESRTNQRFHSNFRSPSDQTTRLIRQRRGR